MKQWYFWFGLMVLATGLAVAAEPGGTELSLAALDELYGEGVILSVDRDAQTMSVTSFSTSQLLSQEKPEVQSYQVKVTTSVVRNQDVSLFNPKDAPENINRVVNTPDGNQTHPKQFPAGTYSLGDTKQLEGYGTAIKTPATQTLAYTNKFGSFSDGGYYVHEIDPTKSMNTMGCVGVLGRTNMEKVLKSYSTTGGSKYITVSSSRSRGRTSNGD